MTFSELVRRVAQVTGHDKEDIEGILDAAMTVIASRLRIGEDVKVRGLGTLHWQFRKKSRRRNPKTQEWVEVPEKFVLKFRPVKKIRDMKLK